MFFFNEIDRNSWPKDRARSMSLFSDSHRRLSSSAHSFRSEFFRVIKMAKKTVKKSTLHALRVKPADLRWVCDPKLIPAKLSSSLTPINGLLGQERALEAVSFGLDIPSAGYNIFVHGDPGSGKHNAIQSFVKERALKDDKALDWLYVQNFDTEHKPIALCLPGGEGQAFKAAIETALAAVAEGLPSLFDDDDTKSRAKTIEAEFRNANEAGFKKLSNIAEKQDLAIAKTEQGLSVVPMKDGTALTQEEFEKLPKKAKKTLQDNIQGIQQQLADFMSETLPELDKTKQLQLKALYEDVTKAMVSKHLTPVVNRYASDDNIKTHLNALADDLAEYTPLLAQLATGTLNTEQGGSQHSQGPEAVKGAMKRYKVNLLVSQQQNVKGAPVVYEDWPGVGRMVGRIEHISQMGTLETNFGLIKSGALHRANGGYLLLDARRVLSAPGSWETLKRALRTGEISIDSPYSSHTALTTVTLEPATIPLKVKVIIFGNRSVYYRLAAMDPDFTELFKVAADFDDRIERKESNIANFARLLAGIADKESLLPLNKNGMAAAIEHAVRMTNDQQRITLRVGPLADLLREANYVAKQEKQKAIGREQVRSAIDRQINRVDRVKQRYHEQIHRESVLIDVSGEKVGQINGLAVMSIGGFAFGKPSRITARTRMGAGRVIDIERSSDLGGSIHSKGMLILSSYLSNHYARNVPVSLSGSIAFEQSYGGVDGDSASSTELYALLSSLSGIPIKQGLAVTGSVNQYGEVQVIGGANEKIEGFFDICSNRPGGLTGEQGVLVPAANIKNLMLRPDVVAACKAGDFNVYGISHINEGIEVLTGMQGGLRDEKTEEFPNSTINQLVENALIGFAEMRRDFGRGKSKSDTSDAKKTETTDEKKTVKAKTTESEPVKKKTTKKKAVRKKTAARKKASKRS